MNLALNITQRKAAPARTGTALFLFHPTQEEDSNGNNTPQNEPLHEDLSGLSHSASRPRKTRQHLQRLPALVETDRSHAEGSTTPKAVVMTVVMGAEQQGSNNRLIDDACADSLNQFFADIHAKRQQVLSDANAATPRITKLSPLQKQILLIALRWRGKAPSDVYSQDIKVEVFGWQPMRHYWSGWELSSSVQLGTARLSEDHPSMANWGYGGQIFDRQSIGEGTYNSVSVTVSRTIKRLTERKLIYQSGAGWSLTDHGLEVAKTASAPTEC